MSNTCSRSLRLAAAASGLVSLLALASGAALAQEKSGQAPVGAAGAPSGAAPPPWVVACQEDMKKLCEADMKGNKDVRPCLAKNEASLSPTCTDVFLKRYKVLELCKDDIAKLCPGMEGKDLGKCFNENKEKVSDRCKSALTKGSKEAKAAEPAKPGEPAGATPAAMAAPAGGKADKAAKADKKAKGKKSKEAAAEAK